MVDIGDDVLADVGRHVRLQQRAARGHVDRLARIFLPVLAHEAAGQIHLHTLVAASLLSERKHCRLSCISHFDQPVLRLPGQTIAGSELTARNGYLTVE